ncbi:hypothetical protein TN53_07710 [Streptomyces sp. WM6386]|nr:hypothetical protein TN53_07710 [Streptomyces sp. WM6386]
MHSTLRAAAALLACVCLAFGWAPQAAATERGPVGWASTGTGTTGGAGGTVWTVRTRAELKEALANAGDPTAPKVIRAVGDINGHEADDGSLLGEQDYAPGYDLAKYMSCFGEDGTTWSDTRHDYCKQQRQLRQTGSNKEKARFGQVHVVINVYRGQAPLYALGVGVESAIYSERNVFRYDPILALAAYGGEHFHDTGSWFNGRPARLNTVASGLGPTDDVGGDPAGIYDYRPLTSPAAVEHHVLTHAGAGRPYDHP